MPIQDILGIIFFSILLFGVFIAVIMVGAITFREKMNHERLMVKGILDASAAFIILLDAKNRIISINETCMRLFGWRANDIRNQSVLDFITVPLKILNSPKAAEMPNSGKFSDVVKAGNGIYRVDWQMSYLYDNNGKFINKIISGLDMTELRSTQEALLENQKRLRELSEIAEEKERKQLAEELHDRIGHTLALSRSKIEVLLEGSLPNPVREGLNVIEEELVKIIRETRSLIFELSPHSLYNIGVAAAIETMTQQLKRKWNANIIFKNDEAEKTVEKNIALLLFKTARELIVNALKHSNGNQIHVFCRRENHFFQLEVSDNGTGFPLNAVLKKPRLEGGFGLANISERVKYYNGTIQFNNQSGCQIIINVPLKT